MGCGRAASNRPRRPRLTRPGARRRWPTLVLGAAVRPVLTAHTALWLLACTALEGGAQEAVRLAALQGWQLGSAPPHRAGWPLAAEIVFDDLVAAGGPEIVPAGLVWRADSVRLRLGLLAPTTLVIAPTG